LNRSYRIPGTPLKFQCIIRDIGKGEEVQSKGAENILIEIIARKFPNLGKEIAIQVQETFRKPNRQDQKRTYISYIIVKTLNLWSNDRTSKAAREKDPLTY
jgi:hypothetical protein